MKEISEGEIESPYLSEDLELKKISPFHVYWTMMKVTAWQNFAHHPTCSRYANHVFKIGRVHLCVGCASLYPSLITYLILFFSIPSVFKDFPLISAILFIYGCTAAILHYLLKVENKWLKAFLRSSLGWGLGGYSALIIQVPKWWIRFLMIIIFMGGNILYGLMRKGANFEECETCPLSSASPPCNPIQNTHNKLRILNEILDYELKTLKGSKKEDTNTTTDANEVLDSEKPSLEEETHSIESDS